MTCGKELPGRALGLPSAESKRPRRAPSNNAPASAAHPPTEWTNVEPAKSLNPNVLSQPSPHTQLPVIGYIKPVSRATNAKNGQILMRSASAPDTIDAAVATKTIWKNHPAGDA